MHGNTKVKFTVFSCCFLVIYSFITCLVSSVVKFLSSSVSIGSSIDFLICLWYLVSSDWSSLGIRCSSVYCSVSHRPSLCDTLTFYRVSIILLLLTFPAADLYTMFHGFVDSLLLQYCFHDCILPFFILAWYWAFSAWYFTLFTCMIVICYPLVFPSECIYPLPCYW